MSEEVGLSPRLRALGGIVNARNVVVWTRLDGDACKPGDIYVDGSCGDVFEAVVSDEAENSFTWKHMFVTKHTHPAEAGALLLEVDEFKRKQPKALDQITDGFWWTRDRATGELEVVKVVNGYLSGYPTRRGKVAWKMSDMGHDSDNLDAGLLEEVDFISRIPEPA